ncbi:hypothetical protein BARBAKC583_1189 [Bartonella bacilliformis KC583]|uniref:Uncharacterized protein n=1 Tax=Bartonella bacilliformis (strain ATCC 35685 / KC583 / Herrer 020/F12,63) TaxID=360095 RepID=A1UTZ1_BARBK|nr:hypothetical protein BARBAKC583_1189 [Bartonella bacilliformis KC583]
MCVSFDVVFAMILMCELENVLDRYVLNEEQGDGIWDKQ